MDDIPSLRRLVREHPLLNPLAGVCGDASASLVGGVVRDGLLGRDHSGDVDVVVEGDGIAVARRLAEHTGARLVTHERFGTALVTGTDGRSIDIVSARRESYPRPGVLPEVEPGTITDDLTRRDFTINAMAHRLTGSDAGHLLDPFDGRRDLEAGLVRVLHPASFVDDPSRLLRAVRYAARLGFALAPDTAALARGAASSLTLSVARNLLELRRLLDEDTAADALDRARALGVPWVVDDPDRENIFRRVAAAVGRDGAPAIPVWALRLALAVGLDERGRVALDAETRAICGGVDAVDGLTEALGAVTRRSEVDRILRRAHPATQVIAVAHGEEIVADWWATTRDMVLAVDGDDVVGTGIASGPRVGRVLADLRAAVIDGHVGTDRAGQMAYIAKMGG